MWSTRAREITILGICIFIALALGNIIGSSDYERILLLSYGSLGLFAVSATGYIPLIAFGLLNPFILPVPFIRGVPFLAVMLGVCVIKLIMKHSVTHTEAHSYRRCLTFFFGAFFAWVAFRYMLKPVMPNLSGFGENITGFRSYLNYGICLVLILMLPHFIRTRADALTLLKWMAGTSLAFILFLVPLMFTRSALVAFWLQAFGLFVTSFGSGWLRFVVLPGFGLVLVILALLPHLLPVTFQRRLFLACSGTFAIIMGGNRSTAVMAVAAVACILVLRRKFKTLATLGACTLLALGLGHVLGEGGYISGDFPLARVIAVVSPRLALESGAEGTVLWREMRWERAMEEIRRDPWLGKGYGGLENAWMFATAAEFEDASFEIDMATGGVHNGFLASAYALGLPAPILFLIAYLQQIFRSGLQSVRLRKKDPLMSQLHCFAFANLVALLLAIYIGTDLNGPTLWFYLGLSVIFSNITEAESARSQEPGVKSPNSQLSGSRSLGGALRPVEA